MVTARFAGGRRTVEIRQFILLTVDDSHGVRFIVTVAKRDHGIQRVPSDHRRWILQHAKISSRQGQGIDRTCLTFLCCLHDLVLQVGAANGRFWLSFLRRKLKCSYLPVFEILFL